ncbi:hypothetical protein BDR03DRAFT_980319 [Suillus americanus]|nr:hypothetical protein BDR03DRAFT_980319 [Suillus americanus]
MGKLGEAIALVSEVFRPWHRRSLGKDGKATQQIWSSDWATILTTDLHYLIPSEWVAELTHTFVGDLTDAVPHTGVIIDSTEGPRKWEHDPLDLKSPFDKRLDQYHPFQEDGAESTSGWGAGSTNGWGAQPAHDLWGIKPTNDSGAQSANDSWSSTKQQIPHQPELSPSKQRQWAEAQQRLEGLFCTQASTQQEEGGAGDSLCTIGMSELKSSKAWVFEWQPQDDYNGFLLRTHITKAQIEDVWGDYNNTTRVFDTFSNQWDLCLAIDPNSIPDGDDRDNYNDIVPLMLLTVAPPPPPPSYSSFLNDICSYFGSHEVTSSAQYDHIETFVSILHYHLGYRLDAPTSAPQHGSTMFEEWICKMQWVHVCKLVGDLGQDLMVSEERQGVIKSFLGYLKFYIIEPLQTQSLTIWKLAVHKATTAVMCLWCNWGSDIRHIALHLIKRGMKFMTLQKMTIAPHFRRHFSELCMYLRVRKPPHFKAIFADYVEAVPFGLMLCSDDQSYFDDALLEEEVEFICGTYYVDETPNDANGPLSATQWKRSLKFNNGTPKMMKNMDVACYEFLLNKAPVWTDSDV